MIPLSPMAAELNEQLQTANRLVFELLSSVGRRIYLPKGILTQSTAAEQRANRFNATRAFALEDGSAMFLPSSYEFLSALPPNSVYAYAPALGQEELRHKWKTKLVADNPSLVGKAFSTPIVTCGMTHGFSLIGDLFVDKGDRVIMPDRIWGNYRLVFETKYEAEIMTHPFFNDAGVFHTEAFATSLRKAGERSQKIIVILNFPHNPTGYAVSAEEAASVTQAIVRVAETGVQVLVLVDDAYFGLWYDNHVLRESLFGWLIGLHPNVLAIKIDGATKEEYAWGLRVGFLSFGLDENVMKVLEEKITGLIRANTSGTSQLSQTLVLKAMDSPGYAAEKQRRYEILRSRFMKVKEVAYNHEYEDLWDVYPFHAGYFMCIRLKSGDAETVRQCLLQEHGTGVISLGNKDLRIAYSCVEEESIEMLFDAIADAARSCLDC